MTAFRLRFGAEDVDLQQREQSFRGYFSLETLTLRHRLRTQWLAGDTLSLRAPNATMTTVA